MEIVIDLTPSDLERFWSKVDVRGPDECWLWKAGRFSAGYGVFSFNYTSIAAHRISYTVHYGHIGEGFFVLHRCDNPPCVNPNHLYKGTRLDNIIDAIERGGRKTTLNEDDVRSIRASDVMGTVLAEKYGVNATHIYHIRARRYWKHIE